MVDEYDDIAGGGTDPEDFMMGRDLSRGLPPLEDYLSKYNLTRKDYETMLEGQKFKCGICGCYAEGKAGLCIDLDHKTGKVRGLLCSRCNTRLCKDWDTPEILLSAFKYVMKARKKK